MIRAAIAGLAFETTWRALQLPGWTEPQLLELQEQWWRLESTKKLPQTIEMERAVVLELFEICRTNGLRQANHLTGFAALRNSNIRDVFDDYVLGPVWRVSWLEEDELFYLETTQRVLESLRNASGHKSWTRLSVEMADVYGRMESRMNSIYAFRFALSQMTLANFQRAFEIVVRRDVERSLVMAAIAIRRHQIRQGTLPPDLESLVPEFLDGVPVDYMNGEGLRYHRDLDQSFRLYSVGPDGKDDGGNPEPVNAWQRYNSIWDGRDAVWPQAGRPEVEPAGEILPMVQFEDAPVPDVIEALTKCAGLRVEIDPKVAMQSLPPVTTRLENVTAIGALETVLERNGLVLVKHPGTNLVGVTKK